MKIFTLIITLCCLAGCAISPGETEMDQLQELNRKLNVILSSPKVSSNSYDYIKEHKEEYEFLVSQGELTLDHFIRELEQTESNGLREYIMAVVCVEILGEKNPVREWSSGKEWYDLYQRALEGTESL